MQFAEHVQVRPEKFGSVIFETLCEKVFVTNKTGAEILRLLKQHKTPEEIIAQLAHDYGCSIDLIRNDVEEFITNLTNHALLKNAHK
ncbi:MAG: PqqD family protein [Planctomycetes bacterium]|nr:PqqD family protein [Planctomycetota bacterium]